MPGVLLPSPGLAAAVVPFAKRVLDWSALSFALNLVWEIGQLRLYAIFRTEPLRQIAYAVIHCTVGDVLIAVFSLLIAALVTRRADWPLTRPWAGCGIAILFGLSYTAYSEWYNVYQTRAWTYSESMPLVFGIGVSPLLQWFVIPAALVVIVRLRRRGDQVGSEVNRFSKEE